MSGEQRLPCPPSAQKSIFTDLKLCTDFSDAVDPPLDGCPLLVPGGTGVLRQAWANEGVRRGSSAILARRRGGLLSDRRDSSSQQDANSPQSPVNKSPEPLTPTILTVKPFSKLGTPKGAPFGSPTPVLSASETTQIYCPCHSLSLSLSLSLCVCVGVLVPHAGAYRPSLLESLGSLCVVCQIRIPSTVEFRNSGCCCTLCA